MKMSNLLIIGTFILLGIVACQPPEPTIEDLFPKQLNLLQHGIPIAIQTPEDAKVTNRSDNFMQDVIVEGTDYYVQIYSQNATALSCSDLATEAQREIETGANTTFQRMIKEEDCGFIYEVQAAGDTTKCYNFSYYRVQGNKSFSFSTTTGRRKPFTQEQVERIYEAVKAQK
ncbi:hypothetical protein [Aureispira anguillae]|uniref:Lipoprotein n=1 Tax=Aureispira anguillae TaxID=2864201 RepID=A0A915YHW1_9BACT|nr:hypothetical protein [Aureispira anguillae]BDS13483.1 hypothetical protein AsAng_0042210 [Aureispira anguillae]